MYNACISFHVALTNLRACNYSWSRRLSWTTSKMDRQRKSTTRCSWMPYLCHFSSFERVSLKNTPTSRLARYNSMWPALPRMILVKLQPLVVLNFLRVSQKLRAFSVLILCRFVELRWARMIFFKASSNLTSRIASAHAFSRDKSSRFKIMSSLWSTVGHSLAPFQTAPK